jgi:hypothetical protein
MKILFVAPNESGSGEAITALHMAEQLTRTGHTVQFLASEFTSGFLRASMRDRVETLTRNPAENRTLWSRLLSRFKPQVIVFADYPLLFLSSVGRAFVKGPDAVDLGSVDAELLTLDHLGMAQGPVTLSFGPPHLELTTESLPSIPDRMRVLLPCPLHSPGVVSGRRGVPFRCWDVPLGVTPDKRREVRQRFQQSPEELLVFHSVPTWAQAFCQRHQLPYYRFLSRVLEIYLAGQDRPVAVLSVNGGSLLAQSSADDLRIVNLGQLAPGEYEQIMFASDLMLTDNRVSVSLGKAACATLPCVALRNSYRLIEILDRVENPLRSLLLDMEGERLGAVFPFEVFPIWTRADLQALRLFEDNPTAESMVTLEIYGGEETRQALWKAMANFETRESLQARQGALIESIARLPSPEEAMLSSVA